MKQETLYGLLGALLLLFVGVIIGFFIGTYIGGNYYPTFQLGS